MKRVLVCLALSATVLAAACGGSGGSSDNCPAAKTAMLQSFEAFGTLAQDPAIQQCIQLQQTNCPCPGGGTAVANIAQLTLTLTSCKDANGNTFSGVFTFSPDMVTLSADVPVFGSCTNGTASDIHAGTGCGGTISGTCSGANVSCDVVDDPNQPGSCTLNCSC